LFDGEDVWNTANCREQCVGVLGSATAQQAIPKNSSAWQSFVAARENDEDAVPPGSCDEDDGRELRMHVRNEQYTLETGERSRLEVPVGHALRTSAGSATTNVCG
jgi:putative transposase